MAAAAPKSRLHADDRRRQLLKAAVESFAQKGFSGTKTKDIATAAGVSEAILFRHFASKEDLYHAILDMKEGPDAKNEVMRQMSEAAERRDDVAFFEILANGIVNSFRDDPAFHRLLQYASLEGHVIASLARTRFGVPIGNLVRRYIVNRQKEGAFVRCDPHAAVEYFFGAIIHFASERYLFNTRDVPLEDAAAVKELVMLIVRGLKK